jgi:serine protease AprX
LPFAAVSGTDEALQGLASADGVTGVWRNERLQWHLHESVNLVFGGAARRDAAYAAGYDGSGQNVAIIDSGVDSTHLDIQKRIVQNVKIVGTDGIATDDTFRHYVECGTTPCPGDTTSGHGTHVASTAAGDGTASDGFYRGVAPGAGHRRPRHRRGHRGLPRAAGVRLPARPPELNVVAINNSYGPSGGARFDATHPINVATKAAHDAGMAVVFSAATATSAARTAPRPGEPEGSSDCSRRPRRPARSARSTRTASRRGRSASPRRARTTRAARATSHWPSSPRAATTTRSRASTAR